jgi:hypothetical protein
MENKYKLKFDSAIMEAYAYVDKIEDITNNFKEELDVEEYYNYLDELASNTQAYDNMLESAEVAMNNGYYNAYLTQSLVNFVYYILVNEVIPNRLEVDVIREYLDDLSEEETIGLATELIDKKEEK